MKRPTVRRFFCLLLLPLILGCGSDDSDGPSPPMISDVAPAQGDSQPAGPESQKDKAPPRGPSAVSPTSAY